jgi:Transposase
MKAHFSAGRIAALLAQPPRKLAAEQQVFLDGFLGAYPAARSLRRLVNSFRAMLRWHRSGRLSAWIELAATSEFPFVAQYAKGLRRELEEIALSIASCWSNGPVEGQINRLKVITLRAQQVPAACAVLLQSRVGFGLRGHDRALDRPQELPRLGQRQTQVLDLEVLRPVQ